MRQVDSALDDYQAAREVVRVAEAQFAHAEAEAHASEVSLEEARRYEALAAARLLTVAGQ
jgi:hypothetical protein